MATQKQQATTDTAEQFGIQKLYVKDLSLESPSSPQIFTQEWKPEVHLDINTQSNTIDKGVYEVVLTVTASVKSSEKTAFLVEVKQAGIFTIAGFSEENLNHTLGSFCPGVLYPYAREVVSDVVTRAGFPQLILAPINFEAIYQDQLMKEQQAGKSGKK
ncbi:MAG: protein-export chaperone SecB, partial [Proteobacteria bacterium]|nr:protein-export chaperone SecB [Pseudomonadota bacterium]